MGLALKGKNLLLKKHKIFPVRVDPPLRREAKMKVVELLPLKEWYSLKAYDTVCCVNNNKYGICYMKCFRHVFQSFLCIMLTNKLIQSSSNGSNIFGTMQICSRQG